ncbi:MAG: cytidine deaminase [Planctomycetes bacterium]|nr:cytidine deaminase [Planctomycetota bacterium]
MVEAAKKADKTVWWGALERDTELVIGLVSTVGTESRKVGKVIEDYLKNLSYEVQQIHISTDVIPIVNAKVAKGFPDEFTRIKKLMDAGNQARKKSGDYSVLALGAITIIGLNHKNKQKPTEPKPASRRAYIVSSLKHPDEVRRFREVYPHGFYLIGIHSDRERRLQYLTKEKQIPATLAEVLIERDYNEDLRHGQRVSETFHLSDFFVRLEADDDTVKNSIWRLLEVLFGHPNRTPTFDEYAMFMAYSSSLKSADLSRQVGAVIAKDFDLLATGANECPASGGGTYWPQYDGDTKGIRDFMRGRDYTRGEDSNKVEQRKIVLSIVEAGANKGLDRRKLKSLVENSQIKDLTEYGRVVHAEMDALLTCARRGTSSVGATLYCTTFPCHNCAKHIVASGIKRVVFIEPYEKSKAAEFHDDSILLGFDGGNGKVRFEPFVGVGPGKYFDLYSMTLSRGWKMTRKNDDGTAAQWKENTADARIQMLPESYLQLERKAAAQFSKHRKKLTS